MYVHLKQHTEIPDSRYRVPWEATGVSLGSDNKAQWGMQVFGLVFFSSLQGGSFYMPEFKNKLQQLWRQTKRGIHSCLKPVKEGNLNCIQADELQWIHITTEQKSWQIFF